MLAILALGRWNQFFNLLFMDLARNVELTFFFTGSSPLNWLHANCFKGSTDPERNVKPGKAKQNLSRYYTKIWQDIRKNLECLRACLENNK